MSQKHDYGDDMTPDEIAVLEARAAEAAAGAGAGADTTGAAGGAGEPGEGAPGSSTTPEADAAAAAAAAAQAAAVGAADDKGKTDAQPNPDAVAALLDEENQRPGQVTYQVGDIEALKTQRTDLRKKADEIEDKLENIRSQWDNGEIDDAKYTAEKAAARTELRTVRDQSDELLRTIASGEALAQANEQATLQSQQATLTALAKASAKAGLVDYGDAKVSGQFDRQLDALMNDPDWSGKTFEEVAQKAHELVCLLNGKTPGAAPAPTPAPAPAPAGAPAAPAPPAQRNVPPSLAGMPAAGAAPIGNDLMGQLENLDADAAEELMARLPAGQRENLFRATVRPTK